MNRYLILFAKVAACLLVTWSLYHLFYQLSSSAAMISVLMTFSLWAHRRADDQMIRFIRWQMQQALSNVRRLPHSFVSEPD